jgi:hypothetical protein
MGSRPRKKPSEAEQGDNGYHPPSEPSEAEQGDNGYHPRPESPDERARQAEVSDASGGVPTSKQVKAAVAKVAPKPDPVEAAKAAGIIPEGAAVEIDGPDSEDTGPAPAAPELPDAEWLETLPARKDLSDVRRPYFDAEALAFRAATPLRLKFARGCKPITNRAKKQTSHIGPWMARHFRYLKINDPSRWVACAECGGTGEVPIIGRCPPCNGDGFHV